MKWPNLIFLLVLIVFSVFSRSVYAQHNYVCLDPGHGGYDDGCKGRIYGVKEDSVNLGVGAWAYIYLYNYYWWPIMTREEDVYRTWQQRAETANKANGGDGVDAFVSIHHNASKDTIAPDTITNYTMTIWCNKDSTDSNWVRSDTTDTLAQKVYLKLRDFLHYPPHGADLNCGFLVLRLTKMGSTLSEASFLSCAEVERGFYFYFSSDCQTEAEAIFRGTVSYLRHAGIAIVKNSYSGGNGGELIISKWDLMVDECFATDTVYSPHTACWLGGMFGEAYCLQAITPQWMGGYQRTFHHWAHLDQFGYPIEIYYDPLWKFEVPYWEQSVHRYVAYFTGGYSAQVVIPNGGNIWHPGEQRDIVWNASIGADSSTLVSIYLDRNGGNGGYPEYLGARYAKTGNSFSWTVSGPYSTHCRIKVVAEDIAGNSAWDVSNNDFIISDSGNHDPEIDSRIHCKYPQGDCQNCFHYGESKTIEVHAHDDDQDSMFYEWWCGPPPLGGHFSNGQNHIITPQNYVVYTAPAKLKAGTPTEGGDGEESTGGDNLSVGVTDVRGGQSWTDGWIDLFDPGYSCLCGDANRSGVIEVGDVTTIIGYLFKGGQPPLPPILRGDANNNCLIDVGDATVLINYLYKYGSPPECCWIH